MVYVEHELRKGGAMFSEMVADLSLARLPDPASLRKRFDLALTKKLGVVRLPPAFWMNDPKINPRSDHLFWASLLIRDRQRIELALSVLAAEIFQEKQPDPSGQQQRLTGTIHRLIESFFAQIPDQALGREIRHDLETVIPEWFEEEKLDSV